MGAKVPYYHNISNWALKQKAKRCIGYERTEETVNFNEGTWANSKNELEEFKRMYQKMQTQILENTRLQIQSEEMRLAETKKLLNEKTWENDFIIRNYES